MHLPSAVFTASTHTETHAYDGGEHHKQDPNGRTDEESGLVVDPLQGKRIHPIIISLIDPYVLWVSFKKRPYEEFTCSMRTTFSGCNTATRGFTSKKKTENKVSVTAKRLRQSKIPVSKEGCEGSIESQGRKLMNNVKIIF